MASQPDDVASGLLGEAEVFEQMEADSTLEESSAGLFRDEMNEGGGRDGGESRNLLDMPESQMDIQQLINMTTNDSEANCLLAEHGFASFRSPTNHVSYTELNDDLTDMDSKSHGVSNEPAESQTPVKPLQDIQIFSSVMATLSDDLVRLIPGSVSAVLDNVCDVWHLQFNNENDKRYNVTGDLQNVCMAKKHLENFICGNFPDDRQPPSCRSIQMSGTLSNLPITESNSMQAGIAQKTEKFEPKDVVKPTFSSSGRQIKQKKQLDYLDQHELEDVVNKSMGSDRNRKIQSEAVSKLNKKAKRPGRQSRVPSTPVSKDDVSVTEATKTAKTDDAEDTAYEDNSQDDSQDNSQDDTEAPRIDVKKYVKVLKNSELSSVQLGVRKQSKNYENSYAYKFYCQLCSYKTKRKSHLEKHEKLHKPNIKLHICEKCDFTTIRSSTLQCHMKTHSKHLKHCKLCKFATESRTVLAKHERLKHNLTDKEQEQFIIYDCAYCSYKTKAEKLFYRHLKRHSAPEFLVIGDKNVEYKSEHKCPFCQYQTLSKALLKRHMMSVHTMKRPFMCDQCGQMFKRKDVLLQHNLTHLDDGDAKFGAWECNFCPRAFNKKANLLAHEASHTNKRPFPCTLCALAFKTKPVLRMHVKSVHSNPGNYCLQCNRKFDNKQILTQHIMNHNIEEALRRDEEMKRDLAENAATQENMTENMTENIVGSENITQDIIVSEVMSDAAQNMTNAQNLGSLTSIVPNMMAQPYAGELAANYPSVVVSQMTESDFGQPKVTPTHLVDGVTGVPVLPDGMSSVLVNPAPMEQPQSQLPLELYQLTGKLEDGNLLLETQMPQMNMMVDNNTGQYKIRLDQTQIDALQNKNNVTINMPVPLPLGLNPDLTDMEQISSGVTITNDPLQSTVTTEEALMHDGNVGQLHDSVGPPVGSLGNMSIDEIFNSGKKIYYVKSEDT